jgi:alpha-amylase
MRGVKPDPDIREPMRWNRAENAGGETTWEPSTTHDGAAVSVAGEEADKASLLNDYRMLIHWRSDLSALRDGAVSAYPVANGHIAAYRLDDAQSHLLVVHNLGGRTQTVAVNASRPKGFGRVLRRSAPGAVLANGQLTMPGYSTAILQ